MILDWDTSLNYAWQKKMETVVTGGQIPLIQVSKRVTSKKIK